MRWSAMRGVLFAGMLGAVSACFHPSFNKPQCGPDGACPDGMTCSSEHVCDVPGGEVPDARAVDASTLVGAIVPVVLSMYPTAPVMVDSVDLDIDTGPTSQSCDPAVRTYCVIAGTSFVVGPSRRIRARGLRPLVLVSLTTFDLSGDIDVSSLPDGVPGAGAIAAIDCMGVTPPPVQPTGNSGGYGGSFGGKGSNGDGVNGSGGVASSFTVSWPSPLRGGCPGGNGATGGGFGGNGGGAVAIIADSININGRINASGAGGRGGVVKSGGGGGGSGGMIVLDVPPSRILRNGAGLLFASGGGGGEGGTGGASAAPGRDGGNALAPAVGALGGASTNDGGDGGTGSFGHFLSGGSTPGQIGVDGGGGGGGGAAGLIYAPGITGDNFIAPPSSMASP